MPPRPMAETVKGPSVRVFTTYELIKRRGDVRDPGLGTSGPREPGFGIRDWGPRTRGHRPPAVDDQPPSTSYRLLKRFSRLRRAVEPRAAFGIQLLDDRPT